MSSARTLIKKLVHNPYIDFIVGSILIASALWETGDTIAADMANGSFRAGHGVIVYGIVMLIRSVADMFGGLEFMDEAEYREKREKS